jgi:hypothetical protein
MSGERACEECGFDWGTARDTTISSIASAGARFTDALEPFDDNEVRTRPAPDVWSALEYTAHTRDALDFYDERVRRVVTEEHPHLTAVGFARLAEERGYNAEVVMFSLDGLTATADRLAARLRALPANGWERAGIGSDGDVRTVLTLARRGAHEVEHHLMDVARVGQSVLR